MTSRGRSRGNGRQLSSYLLTINKNEEVRLLDVDGALSFTEIDFHQLLQDMSYNEKLTKSRKGIYHLIINPETTTKLTDKDWIKAADVFMEELGLSNQRRAIMLHTKNGRQHAHVPIERYNHETGIMIELKHDYGKHYKARAKLEAMFGEKPTPKFNPKRPAMKVTLTELWNRTVDASTFMKEAKKQGYMVTSGFGKTPYAVVDDTGRSFNLVRHLDGVKTKDVRERLKDKTLAGEKETIAFIRTQWEIGKATDTADPQQMERQAKREAACFRAD
ncbi:MAG: relaxase, partial [Sphingobacteriales bacterium]